MFYRWVDQGLYGLSVMLRVTQLFKLFSSIAEIPEEGHSFTTIPTGWADIGFMEQTPHTLQPYKGVSSMLWERWRLNGFRHFLWRLCTHICVFAVIWTPWSHNSPKMLVSSVSRSLMNQLPEAQRNEVISSRSLPL